MFKSVKTGLGLACAMVVLAGCSSTDTDDTAQQQMVEQTQEPVVEAPAQETAVPLDNVVYFDFDKSLLRSDTRDLLIQHADRLRGTGTSVRLEGHADELGTREYNLALGERRANAVRDFLVLQGVDAGTLEVISYGEERPAVPGSNESARAQNRRVVIVK
ncbi:peptidoglycan-associated lipoprotein [Microbulbifer flavimaris]|uniref:Peptidoglycan-associated lipoprotein n=1 Tax=Microbulbifer flavimaris TaxID=1781068 RepID=A0ABX4I0W6_9GAMM|nr:MULTISPECIES: OmpA family protein [Microbulbifer]KUJ83405.1 peptidoglycan-associated lipoprotein [Microbulbifer sp. ZGT114]PCO05560.1 peptidoglycan-associated lipoprotein [Microbulbifer flavimaris]